MKNLNVYKNYILIVFISLVSFSYAQDSSKIIILSKDIGMIVDSEEKKEYAILTGFDENFISAFYYLSSDNKYYCNIKLKHGDSIKDSILNLNYASIRNTAARVQALEKRKKGDQNFNVENVELIFANGKDVKNLDYEQNKIKIEEINSLSSYRKLPTNRLDLNYEEIIARDFKFGLSIGIVYNSATFDGLDKIFNLLEENIPEEPYEIPSSSYTFSASPLFRFSSMLIYRNTIIGEIEYSLSFHDPDYSNLDYKTFAISFSYVIPIFKNPYPYVTLGYSASKFTVVKNYNVLVNDNYGRLESITLDGNAKGFKFSLGLMYDFTSTSGVNFYTNYNFYPEVEVNQKESLQIHDIPTVDINGVEVGISLYLKF